MNCGGMGGMGPGEVGPQLHPQGGMPAVSCNAGDAGFVPVRDQCACGGLVCDAAKTCLKVFEPPPSALGGPGNYFNGCFEVCTADADCGANRICANNVYGVRECVPWVCRATSECTADRCGTCRLGYIPYHAGSWALNEPGNRCVYQGPCASNSCANCTIYDTTSHICP
jgi:hypothetical protein